MYVVVNPPIAVDWKYIYTTSEHIMLAGAQLWEAVQAMAVKLDQLYPATSGH
jgi:hypothetical protein